MARIESLESRIAPASLVNVTYLNGALTLTGGADADDVTITLLDAITIELQGAGGTQFHLDGSTAADSDTLRITAPLKSLTATLGAENDYLGLVGLNIAGDITIDAGSGNNTVDINTVAIKGGLKITGGAAGDIVNVGPGNLSVKKDVILDLGAGDNSLNNLGIFQVSGLLNYTGGSGVDQVKSPFGSLSVGKDLSLTMGAGDSTISFGTSIGITGVTVGKKFTVDTGASAAADTVAIDLGAFTTKFGGDVQITDGAGKLELNQLSIGSVLAKGNLQIKAGAGEAEIGLGGTQFSAKSIDIDVSASSASTVSIGSISGLGGFGKGAIGAIKVTGGAGDDYLTIQNAGNGSGQGASLVVDLGEGSNTILATAFGAFYKTVQLASGSGDDSITLLVFSAKSSSVDIQTGAGTDSALIALINSTVSGKISVSNASTAVQGDFSFNFLGTTIGGLDVNVGGAGNTMSFGAVGLGGGINGLTVKKDIHVVAAGGDDVVDFSGASNVKVGGKINLELGEGTNGVQGAAANFVTKGLSVTGGSGQDVVALQVEGGKLGDVVLNLGAGANFAQINGGVTLLALKSLTFNSTSATGDDDGLTLARISVAGKLDAKFGAGVSTLEIDNSIFNGVFNVETGAGADIVGLDTAASFTGTVFNKAVTILLGDGADTLTLGGNIPSALITAKATFTADGGTGANTLTNVGNIFAKDPVFLALP